MTFYAENLESFPAHAEAADVVIVKTHIPSPALQFLARFACGTVFISVREPRDAIASLMQRFNHKFENCLREVTAGASRTVELAQSGAPILLRYEDKFYDRPETVAQVAAHLGVKLSALAVRNIYESLTRDRVKEKIRSLERKGMFGRTPDPDRFDPGTHWHPGHVGDATIGKYATVLSPRQQRAVLAATREYCAAFGYPHGVRPGAARTRTSARKVRRT